MDRTVDILVIGGGPAGLAAAVAAKKAGVDRLLILERDGELGGILNQCIHNGFGLHTFKEELTGPEYAARYEEQVRALSIPFLLHTIVVNIEKEDSLEGTYKLVTAMNRTDGLFTVRAKAVILAMGCRERPRGALNIPGYRPAGIYSAGTAQRYVNIEGRMPGKEIVILGSGDIGLIMARRMTLEGAKVKLVAELMPYSGGLKRNIVQCLEDFSIPLKLSHTVVDIDGRERVKGVTVAQVDEKRKPVPGTEEYISCDTLLLSCGLIPENELSSQAGVLLNPVTSGPVVDESLETSVEGVFACGNVLHVHDLVDFVSEEAAQAGICAARYVREREQRAESVRGETQGQAKAGNAVRERRAEAGKAVREKQREAGKAVQERQREAEKAVGKGQAEAEGSSTKGSGTVELLCKGGVRYTVPSYLHVDRMEPEQVVRFRVGDVYKDVFLTVYFDDTPVIKQRKKVMAPGEMEQLRLKKEKLMEYPGLRTITVAVEKEGGESQ